MRMISFQNVSSSCIDEHVEESLLVFVLIYIMYTMSDIEY